jgi:dihydrofolate synthase/folylpolyglutamate synthase
MIHRDPALVLDGAHNPAGARALRHAVDETFPGAAPRVLLCGLVAGRAPLEFLEAIGARDFDLVVATEPESRSAVGAVTVARAARALGTQATSVRIPRRALAAARSAAGRDGLVLATGSLYLIGDLHRAIEGPGPGDRTDRSLRPVAALRPAAREPQVIEL